MVLFIVQFVLPALLGYTLYAGTADRLSPLRPVELDGRPRWLLGLGIALSVGGVVGTTLHQVHGLSLQASGALLQPAALALALALSATLAATGTYRFRLARPCAAPVRAVCAAMNEPVVDGTRWGSVAERCDRAAERLGTEPPPVPVRPRKATPQGLLDATSAQTRVERKTRSRLALQVTVATQRKDLRLARQDLRRGVEARTRILGTATRTLEHARRAAAVRRHLKRELEQARAALATRQEVIGSLMRALDEQGDRHREEVAGQAGQQLHGRRTEERRGPERLARDVEGGLGSGRMKDVAETRSLIGG